MRAELGVPGVKTWGVRSFFAKIVGPTIWVWVNTYRYIFSGMNEHPFTSYFDVHQGYQGFDP